MTRTHDSGPLLADRVYGAIALALLLLAAFFALRGGPEDGAAPAVPTLTILAPEATDSLVQPLTLVFDAGTTLQQGPAGWTADERHVHVRVGTTELMPGPGEVQPLGEGRYRWTLPRLPSGEHSVQLFWSDPAHRPLRAGASAPLRVWLP